MSDANSRISDLVTSNDVVLFMKGTPLFPQCGFSSRAVAIRCGQANQGLSSGLAQATNAILPSGRRADRRFRRAATGSAKNIIPKRDATRSNATRTSRGEVDAV